MSTFSPSFLSRIFRQAGSARRNKTTSLLTLPAEVDVLESRELLSAVVIDGTLVIQGEPGGQNGPQSGAYVEVRNHPTDTNKVQVFQGQNLQQYQDFNRREFTRILFHGTAKADKFYNETNISSTAYGYDGKDLLQGGSGVDYLYGGEKADTIIGGLGGDFLYGEGGNDTIFGDTNQKGATKGGNDRIFGGLGNDILDDGPGADIVVGGGGIDDFRIRSGGYDDGAVDRISMTDVSELQVESYWARRFDDFRLFGYLWG